MSDLNPHLPDAEEPRGSLSAAYSQMLEVIARWLLLAIILVAFSLFGGSQFEHLDARSIASTIKETNPFFHGLPHALLTAMVYIFHPTNSRYMLFPLAAISLVMVAGAFYVQDIYGLRSFKQGLQYVMASIFGLRYPVLEVDHGARQLVAGQPNLLNIIGGPGFVLVQPGNSVLFRTLRSPSLASTTRSVFLEPFESLGPILSLKEQQGRIEELETITSDGIRVRLTDLNFRFHLLLEPNAQRAPDNPYPFSQSAFRKLAYALPVDEKGNYSWLDYVTKLVKNCIADYVNAHDIDFLTAPRRNEQDPRRDFRETVMRTANDRLTAIGTELIWLDSGHFELPDPDVTLGRINYWAADWAGEAQKNRAYSQAKQTAYAELGRAEAQAELIMGISSALADLPAGKQGGHNVRNLLLMKTAQILDAMKDSRSAKPPAEERQH